MNAIEDANRQANEQVQKSVAKRALVGPDLYVIHDADPDGMTCGWLINRYIDSYCGLVCQLHGQDKIQNKEMYRDKDVIICDLSFDREELLQLQMIAKSVLLLDHHASAKEKLGDLDFCIFDTSQCAAGVVSDWIAKQRKDYIRPTLVNYIDDLDTWKWAQPRSKTIAAAIYCQPLSLDAWNWMALDLEVARSIDESDLFKIGQILELQQRRDMEMIKENTVVVNFEGYEVPCVNSILHRSDLGHQLCEEYNSQFAIVWYAKDRDTISVSLRSSKYEILDIAQKYGGGGHPKAAGFRLTFQQMREVFKPL